MSTPQEPVSIFDLLDSIAAELDARDAEMAAANERYELGCTHITASLELALYAEAAAFGVDWPRLLAAAVERCTTNTTRH